RCCSPTGTSALRSPFHSLSLHDALPIYVFHARGTQLIKLVGFHFSIDAALVLCSFLCSFKQNFMGCFGQLVPGGHTHDKKRRSRSEEHTSELQSRFDLVCRLLLEKKSIY